MEIHFEIKAINELLSHILMSRNMIFKIPIYEEQIHNNKINSAKKMAESYKWRKNVMGAWKIWTKCIGSMYRLANVWIK